MILHRVKNTILVSFFLLFYGMSSKCLANTLETQLSSDQVVLGNSVFVTYIVNSNAVNGPPDFSVFKKDFRVLNTNYGNAINMVNGVTSSQTFWRLQLQPMHAGELIIPEINFGGSKSNARKLMVTAAVMNQAKQNIPVFVRGDISSTSPYVQSQVIYTFKLYFNTQLRDPRVELPQMKDVIFRQLSDSPVFQTTINGKVYNVLEKTFALFPTKTGTTTILPMKFHALALDENAGGYYDPFTFDEPKVVDVSTKEVNLTVRDVPANYQGGAWLPAKSISFTEQWSDDAGRWESGTPVTRTIKIEAQGLRADQLPDLNIDKINNVSVYVDRPKRNNDIRNDTVVGIYEQKVTYIPNGTQSITIPPLNINWWNTQTNTNAVAQLQMRSVQVKAGAGASNSLPAPMPLTQTITSQKTPVVAKAFYTSMWFWVACALLAAWVVTLWALLRKKSEAPYKAAEQKRVSSVISDKIFEQACHAGDAIQAQQYILCWAKSRWPEVTLNLATLRELIQDEQFNQALRELEQVLYAKKAVAWNGASLQSAFQRIRKSRKYFDASVDAKTSAKLQADPLPPLNPSHSV